MNNHTYPELLHTEVTIYTLARRPQWYIIPICCINNLIHNQQSFCYITLSSSSQISTDGRSKWWRWWLKVLCFKYIWVITLNYENIFDSTENLIHISRGHFGDLSDKLKFDWVMSPHPVLVLSSSYQVRNLSRPVTRTPSSEFSTKSSFELRKLMFLLVFVTYGITLLCSITYADATGV